MIKATVNGGNVHLHEIEGNAIELSSELCCLVEAVMTAWTSDEAEDERDSMRSELIATVGKALIANNRNHHENN